MKIKDITLSKSTSLYSILEKIEATEADGWDHAKSHSCCPGDDWADGYNAAISDVMKLIKGKNLS